MRTDCVAAADRARSDAFYLDAEPQAGRVLNDGLCEAATRRPREPQRMLGDAEHFGEAGGVTP